MFGSPIYEYFISLLLPIVNNWYSTAEAYWDLVSQGFLVKRNTSDLFEIAKMCKRGEWGFLGNQEQMEVYFVILEYGLCYVFTNAVCCFMIINSTILSN